MRLMIIGAGGFSSEVADLVEMLGHEIVAFVDPGVQPGPHRTTGKPVVPTRDGLECDGAVIAVGDVRARRAYLALQDEGIALPALVHPSAWVSPHVTLGAGVLLMNNVVVSAPATVEAGALVNVGAYVAHDCFVGEGSHIAPGVRLSGGSRVGRGSLCGTNTVLLAGVSVGDGCVCGAGAVVTRDVPDGVTVAGVPARMMKDGGSSVG